MSPCVPSFNTGSGRPMLRARIHIISAVVKSILCVSSRRKRPTEIGEEELLKQVETTDWTMAEDIEDASLRNFSARKNKHT